MYIRTFDLQSSDDDLKGFDFIFHKLLCKDELKLSEILIFDIETTGFSPKNTFCYLIGCIYFQDNTFKFIQWFADSKEDEKEILEAFFAFLKNYRAVFHYNGNGFDIPYLMQKAASYGLAEDFLSKESIDLYKLLSPYKKFFKLENLKQKTVEAFLGIDREDEFGGGELIRVYSDYLIAPTEEAKKLLLLHNKDDICGLFGLIPILAYHALFNGLFTITGFHVKPYMDMYQQQQFEFYIELKLQVELPKRISYGCNDFYFIGNKGMGKLKIKVHSGELKFFYHNYKDYYYLPNEDIAIHKSVASYVDKEYRTKAKSSNCYIKKSGHFLPQEQVIISPSFKENYNDKTTYFELTDEVLNDLTLMKKYVLHVFSVLLK
ncbi:ribonuclease H-like domain-containing protein [Konateibacter massiliensis]|uniref:ribonuclease H-like domain-containing protein n=1 Tax=Konateibacter massiliensis TaxID=2002841 RepID=UPI000C161848|nr:ribonuclease H-like domain-containing protein [Konateibacter massiliensis]